MKEDEHIREVVGLAARLQDEERERTTQRVDVVEVASELGIEPRFVRKAEARFDARSKLLWRALILAPGLLAALAGGIGVVYEAKSTRPDVPPPVPKAVTSAHPLRGRAVVVDRGASDGPRGGEDALARVGAVVTSRDAPTSPSSLAGVDVLLLVHPRRRALASAEVDAITAFVERGGGLVVADLGWSWTTYEKRPLAELPANALGARLGFTFTSELGELPVGPVDARSPALQRRTDWVPGVLWTRGGEIVLRDRRGAPIGALLRVGEGAVMVLGHHAILDESPQWLVHAAASVLPRR